MKIWLRGKAGAFGYSQEDTKRKANKKKRRRVMARVSKRQNRKKK